MLLRDYQQKAIDDIRGAFRAGFKRPLLVAPTGSGKTHLFCSVAHGAAAKGNRIIILVHRQELIDQVSETLKAFDVPHGFIAAGIHGSHEPVQVASVMTLVRRLDRVHAPDLLVCDEGHHATSESFATVLNHWPNARLLGVTATPCRLTGAGLGTMFDTLISGPTVKQLTAAGHLAPAKVYAPPTISTDGMHTLMGDYLKSEISAAVDKPKVTGDAIEHYQRLTPGQKAVVFCVSLEHARHIAEAARAAGIVAVTIDGGMDRELRRRTIADFSRGAIQWLVTVDLVSEGFDVKDIQVGICLRPTQSLALYLQQVGRCLRTAPGKTHATILDHSNNCRRFGLPDEDREWTLDAGAIKKSKASERPPPVVVCVNCFSAQTPATNCQYCGHAFPVKARKVTKVDGELTEITAADVKAIPKIGRKETNEEARAKLEAIARERGYKPGWVTKQMELRHRA